MPAGEYLRASGSCCSLPRIFAHKFADLRFGLGPDATRPRTTFAAHLRNQPPVTERLAPERAFGHLMTSYECLDVCEQGLFHSPTDMRVVTRLSTSNAGNLPLLRDSARKATMRAMSGQPKINVPALKKAIIEATGPGKQFSRRKLAMLASDGKNPDLVRDLISRGQDRNVSFDTAVGIAAALGRDVSDFVVGNVAPISGGPVLVKVIGDFVEGVVLASPCNEIAGLILAVENAGFGQPRG